MRMTISGKPHIWLFQVFHGLHPAAIIGPLQQLATWDYGDYTPYANNSGSLLLEYDAVVWRSPGHMRGNQERDKQLSDYWSHEEKIFVFFLDHYSQENNMDLSTLGIVLRPLEARAPGIWSDLVKTQQGRQLTLTSEGQLSPFREYLEYKPQQWSICIDTRESNLLIPLAVNTAGNAVAFSIKTLQNRTFFLPVPSNDTHGGIFLSGLLEAIGRAAAIAEPVPTWTGNYKLPGMNELQEKIDKANVAIESLQREISTHETALRELERIRDILLSSDGRNLENAVKDVLAIIGYNPVPGPRGQQDLTFSHKELQFLAEVKGATSSASESHIKQLHAKKTQFVEDRKVDIKGVLVVNAWRQYQPAERQSEGRVIFPDAMMPLVRIWQFCLVTTTQLLQIYQMHLGGKLDRKKLASEIYNTIGPLQGYELK